jgi:hypothetical protein
MNWIMGYLESINFAVLINGSPSSFFRATRGLRQGCPMSPFLFLLIAEGLGRLIFEARDVSSIRRINVTGMIMISHLLFIDDILLFG